MSHNLNVEKMLSAYIECALWSSTDESEESGGEPIDKNYSRDDLDESALARMRADVEKFVAENHADIELWDGSYSPEEQSGHDFWLTRNRHGAGFWESEWSDIKTNPGERLTKSSHRFGECYLYIGDDGKVYCY